MGSSRGVGHQLRCNEYPLKLRKHRLVGPLLDFDLVGFLVFRILVSVC